ncbi:MAG: hypothetical protein LBC85_00960 [Fibromonadaceae bacterium]|jgi:hypothetical protein|nr:hypothetical protein [Fibromonadaceae bacterium]
MFRLIFLITALVFARDWANYSGQGEVRDLASGSDGTLWAALAWGLEERSASGRTTSYMPGSNGLEAADFMQIFVLPNGDMIAGSKNGTLVRKNKNSNRFETISTSFVGRNRNLEQGLGEIAGNILILPFKGALAFFDITTNRSIITISQIGTSSLETIRRVAVEDTTVWIDLGTLVWKRHINWSNIHNDNFLADPGSWVEAEDMPAEKNKPAYTASGLNFPMAKVEVVSLISGGDAIAWGNDFSHFSRMQNGNWGGAFWANTSGYGDDQDIFNSKSLAMQPNGNFAVGMWGPGLLVFNNQAQLTNWFHSTNTGNTCPTKITDANEGWTIVQGLAPAPNFSGYIFSYVSQDNYGLGFVDNNGNTKCIKSAEASSSIAFTVIARENEMREWEIYVSWKTSLDLGSKGGGVDFYKVSPFQNTGNFAPLLHKKWALPFGSPIEFAFDSQGTLWAISSSKIFYLDKQEDEWKEPSHIRNFNSINISALKTDAQNGLWIGTTGDGAYSLSQINNSPDSLTAKHFRVRDGLLSEVIYDIAIDTIRGKVYFANELGLSVYRTALVRNAHGYMQSNAPKPIAWPNPFRPSLHSAVTIDHISENSTVYILDSSGKRIRLFSGNALRGGAVKWDGKNESGKLVAPGLYHYVARDGKNTAKGKIIVER